MKYVLVGTGNISNTYIAAINAMPNSDVVACVSRSGRAPTSSSHLPSFSHLKDIDIEFDAVIISTPNGLHYQGVIEAAQLNKHVLTEKVLAISSAQTDKMVETCKRANVKLAVSFQRRSSPDNRAIKQLIDNNAFGKIFAADLSAKFYRDQSYYDSGAYRGGWDIDGGGPFMQQAAHNLDIYAWFFGMPQTIHSELHNFAHNIETEDHGAALLRYSKQGGDNNAINNSNMIGTIVASTASKPGFPARLEVHCEKGSFTLLDDVITEWHIDGIDNPANNEFTYKHDGATSAAVSDASAHIEILTNFEHAITNNTDLFASGESAAITTALAEGIYQASNIRKN